MNVGIAIKQQYSLWIHVYLWSEESGFQRAQWGMQTSKQALGKAPCSKKLQNCIYNMILVLCFFFNSTCWDWETGNKILLNAMSSGITFFSLFPIRSYVFQNICHKLAIFITQFFESIWSRGEDFSFHYCWSEAYIIWILEYLVMRMIPPNKFVLYPRDKLCLLYINISFNEPYCKLFAFTVTKSPLCFNSSFLGQT